MSMNHPSCWHGVPFRQNCAACKQETLETLRGIANGGNAHARRVLAMLDPPKVNKGDGHQPAFITDPNLGRIIACECGDKPKRVAQRVSMQHTWHQAHRRGLELPRIEQYTGEWPK
jgi:hypothetical protein